MLARPSQVGTKRPGGNPVLGTDPGEPARDRAVPQTYGIGRAITGTSGQVRQPGRASRRRAWTFASAHGRSRAFCRWRRPLYCLECGGVLPVFCWCSLPPWQRQTRCSARTAAPGLTAARPSIRAIQRSLPACVSVVRLALRRHPKSFQPSLPRLPAASARCRRTLVSCRLRLPR